MPAEASVLGGGMTLTETVKGAASLTARFALYPSILYNLARNRLQENWHWWDKITEHVILGALPFASMLETFQDKGVRAVVTLNEDFEVFISSEQYKEIGISHLHIPTVDYLYAPPVKDLHRGVQFIAEQAAAGEVTYVHCKAGRGRSTTLVICYLVREMRMSPQEAYSFVRQKRPQVGLADGQWNAVREFHSSCLEARALNPAAFPPTSDRLAVEADDTGTPLNDLSPSCAPAPSAQEHSSSRMDSESAQQVMPSAASAAGVSQAGSEGSAYVKGAAAPVLAASSAPEETALRGYGGDGENRSCAEAAAAVAVATKTRLRGANERCCAQMRPAEDPSEGCTGPAGTFTVTFAPPRGAAAASSGTEGAASAALRGAQDASAASLAQSEPVLVTASDADSLRSAATTAAAKIGDAATTAKSGDAAKLSGAEGASSRGDASVRSLSRGSLSMVLCEDFGTALCDADDHHEALPQPGEGASVAGAGSCPEESASKRRRSADALPLHGEPELSRADSGLQRIQDWASVCRDGTLEAVER